MGEKVALVLGASGLTGSHCLKILLDGKSYSKVIALVRSRLDLEHPKLQQAVINFDYTSSMEKYYVGVDDVFCCLCTNLKNAGSPAAFRRVDFHIPTEAANIASGHGVKQFLAISTRGADNHSSNLYKRVKGEMEKGLEQFDFTSLHVFRPAEVKPEEQVEVNGGGFFKRLFNSDRSDPNSEKTPIGAELLAEAMVNAAQSDKEGVNYYNSSQIIKLSGRKKLVTTDRN